jgi:serine/arginine repetitive matrix protein 2
MWNRLSGKSNDTKDDVSSQSTRRNRDESVTTKRHSGSGLGSVVSSRSDKKSSSRGDDRDRGFNPTSTSYSSTSKSPYSGTASASVASSYATASGKNDDNEPYVLPGLVRNASLADQMPKSRSSRSLRDGEEDSGPRTERRRQEDRDDDLASKDRSDRKREKREKGDKKDKDRGLSRSESGFGEGNETSRGPADFPDQVGSVGFSQFPGQYDGAIPDSISVPPDHPSMSSHVQDQFPGQFPTQSTEPYRPPVAASEGGPGLAAEYYGDAGQSVHEQPGFRKNSPSMIVNAEPHLQPALVEAKPPPEPSASGGVGAAASFFSGNFEEDETATSHGQHAPSTYTTAPSRPDVYHSSSAPAIPTIGGVAMGPAAGYFMGSQTASYQQRPDDVQSVAGVQSEYASNTYQRPPSEAQDSYYSNASRPSKPGKSSSHSSNIPMYAAGAAGAAGLAAAAYQQSHHSSSQHASSMAQHPNHSQHPTTQMAPRHRHRGPFGALIDFFQDPDGVAQFEEYSEITGICKYCFEPGSSPRDAPRRHRYRKRRSNERLGSSTRVEKDSRYYSSESENRRNKDKSWLATGLTGYALGKVGETLFKQQNDFDDSYSVKTGRYSPDGRSHKSRRRSRSQGRVETGITSDGKIYKKDPRGGVFGGPTTTTYSTRRPSKSRSRSRDRMSTLTEAALGTAIGASVAGSTSKRRSDSPKGAFVKTSHQSRSRSLEKRRRSHKKKKEKGFFSFGGSSSSSIGDLGGSEKHGSSKRSSTKSKDDKKAEAALLGLGAAAAALALNDSRQGHKQKGVKELVGRKETRDKYDHGSRNGYKPPKVSSRSSEDEGWESAIEEDHGSVDLGLVYGVPARRGSRESLSSESSGTNKWGWRWGSKKQRRGSPPKRKFPDHSSTPAIAGAVGAGLAGKAMVSHDQYSKHGRDSTTSDPLQHVFPVPTSDPGRFDVGREDSVASSSRPGAVPIQHPQPVTPVSAALYSSQAPHEHCYSAPTGPPVFSQPFFQPRPNAIDARYSIPRHVIPGGFPQDNPQIRDAPAGFKLRRRDTSPARFGIDSVLSSMNPSGQFSAKDDTSTVKAGNESVVSAATSSRRFSTKDDSSAVRFAQTEEQEEEERRERRRKRKEEKLRREAEEQEQIDRDRKGSGDKRSKYSDAKRQREEGTEKDSEKSWPAPAALGIAGAAIGVATAMERSKSEETRDERRERRRREREEEEAEEEEKSKRRERRRKERDRDREVEESASKEGRERRDDVPEAPRDVDQQEKHAENEENSVSQKAPSAKYNHENYGDFFTPIELRNKPTDQVKVTSANADADVDLDRSPNIVATGSKVYRDLNALPEFSKADTNDQIDLSRLKFPWQIPPRLRLMEPTPPSTRGSTPVIGPKSASDDEVEPIEPKPSTLRGVTWGDDQTHEYTVITPHDEREEFIESPDDSRDRDRAVVSRATEKRKTSSDRKQQEQPINGATPSNGPTSYGDDLEFAATLAASAEDAGFDPSIVMDDPTYRRRDSPPGSNDRSMPGGFDDEDEPRLSKKERKKKDKAARLQSEDEPNGQDGDAVVRDIVSRIEDPEPQDPQSDPVNEIDDGWDSGKKSKSKKSKKGRKDSESRDEFYETSESPSKSQDAESRQFYHSPTEEAQSVVSGTNASNDGERSKKSRKKSKRDSGDYDDAAPPVSSRIRAETDDDKSKEKKKGSIWSRVLGKSTDSLPQENGAKNVSIEAALEDFEEPKKKKKSKEHRSTRDDFDDNGTRSKSSTTSDRERRRRSSGGSTAQDSGRIAQDLPTKVYPPAPSGRGSENESLT